MYFMAGDNFIVPFPFLTEQFTGYNKLVANGGNIF